MRRTLLRILIDNLPAALEAAGMGDATALDRIETIATKRVSQHGRRSRWEALSRAAFWGQHATACRAMGHIERALTVERRVDAACKRLGV